MREYFSCSKQLSNILKSPNKKSEVLTQLLFGEAFIKLKIFKKFYYGYSAFDKYHGYIYKNDLKKENNTKKYRITKQKSFLFSEPRNNKITKKYLYFNSLVSQLEVEREFVRINGFWIKKKSIHRNKSKNFLSSLSFFLKTKYLWGGNSINGIDCSGLVHELLKSIDYRCPRDTKDQIKFFKKNVTLDKIQKGDLIFWKGHVAIILNKKKLVHAYGPMKKVVIMPIQKTIKILLQKNNLKVLAIKRPI